MTLLSFETQLYTKFDNMDSIVILKYEAAKCETNITWEIFHHTIIY